MCLKRSDVLYHSLSPPIFWWRRWMGHEGADDFELDLNHVWPASGMKPVIFVDCLLFSPRRPLTSVSRVTATTPARPRWRRTFGRPESTLARSASNTTTPRPCYRAGTGVCAGNAVCRFTR